MAPPVALRMDVRTDLRPFEELVRAVHALKAGAHVKVGILGTGKGAATHEGGLTNVELGAIHEYGSKDGTIPERSFIRTTLRAKADAYVKLFTKAAADFFVNHADRKQKLERALGLMGAKAVADIQAAVRGGGYPEWPPLADSTILRKAFKGLGFGRSREGYDSRKSSAISGAIDKVKALIDTGRLLGSLTWKVVLG